MAKNLQSEFVKYYKEKLEPYGFKKVKGRQPYFVRVINDEILHIFTFTGTSSTEYGYKAFQLMGGVATVYKKEINFAIAPARNSDWLVYLVTINEKKDTEYPNIPMPRNFMIYYYNDDNINEVSEESYEGAKIIINELDKVSNMDEVLRYLFKYDVKNITFRRGLDDSCFDEEGLFYASKKFDYNKIEKIFEDKLVNLKNSDLSDKEKRERHERILKWKDKIKRDRNNFINNEKDYEQGMRLLKEHYNTNVDKLIGYGLDIKKMDLKF